ncbi:hydrogenase maturation peptidase HycI [Curtanaerobium respiraculi]|uniref:hydrogenase maturation peptidase HycI n=1 Tax=Curtanaerobium respiraculi TaxID=2949669 RepID=UPI0024B3706E|nr:hydrogenase maturation peptidase HycI [Curtanaerobium respiraculi]
MSGKTVLTVGAVLRGDDAAGPMLAKMMLDEPIEGWDVLDGGQMPEDYLSVIRRSKPDLLVVVDAADMQLAPGEVRTLTADDVAANYLMTTHSLPISLMLEELSNACGQIVFLGIQPAHMDFFGALTPAVHDSVIWIYERLKEGGEFPDVKPVAAR